MPRIFTEVWIQSQLAKYEKRNVASFPITYWLATERGKPIRDEIESWIADVPEELLGRLSGSLLSAEHFRHTYHELAVRQVLKSLGYAVELEPRLDNGLNPDMLATRGDVVFYCEVFTIDTPAPIAAHEKNVSNLSHALRQIEDNAFLSIRHKRQAFLGPKDVTDLVKGIRSWLSKQPSVGEDLDLGEWNIRLAHRSKKDSVGIIGPTIAFFVNPQRLSANLKTKIKRYGEAMKGLGVPLVVAVVPEFSSGISLDSLDDVVMGQEQYSVWVNRTTGESAGGTLSRREDGRFAKSPGLSAVLLVQNQHQTWTVTFRINPLAEQPLGPEAFEAP